MSIPSLSGSGSGTKLEKLAWGRSGFALGILPAPAWHQGFGLSRNAKEWTNRGLDRYAKQLSAHLPSLLLRLEDVRKVSLVHADAIQDELKYVHCPHVSTGTATKQAMYIPSVHPTPIALCLTRGS
jgi:hypothetical protein